MFDLTQESIILPGITDKLSFEEGDVENGGVVIDELE